jgi:modulator of FtsH protease HflK
LKAYQAAKDVTLKRMYLDTMSAILSHTHPLVVDNQLKGMLPFLPLEVPPAPSTPAPARSPAATASGNQP